MFTEETFTDAQCLEKCMRVCSLSLGPKCCMIASIALNLFIVARAHEIAKPLIAIDLKLNENQLINQFLTWKFSFNIRSGSYRHALKYPNSLDPKLI